MSAFSDLRKKLAELFQLDAAAELDFGIYRILNARRVEIEGFLDSLEPQVETILAEALQTGTDELKTELAKTESDLRAMGMDDATLANVPKVRELRDKVASAGGDPTAITHEIFSLLTTFFGRYYKDGDFLSLRRYKKDTYAIPYEGEEVKLHWANADQYYIKSAETYRDYTFKIGPAPKDDKPDTRPTVTFKLTEADSDKDNNKAVAGQERRFVYQGLHQDSSLPENSKLKTENLILSFAHLPIGKAEKQSALNESAAATILAEHAKGPFTGLAANDPTYTGKQKGGRSILAKHLSEYTGKNSFDYFIHKDLGGFLRRELDFFIKNEVVHLDDLDDAPESNWRETRAKIKALRTISGKVIRFLAQIENFQKKLWLKKKFVTACDYVVTLDHIPEELYPGIAACDAQREEWVRLFAIDEIKGDLGRAGYSVPLTVEFLKENRGLLMDTRIHSLPDSFKLLLPRLCSGLAANADNFQTLRMIGRASGETVKMIYIDPPYNTGGDGFAYRDGFKTSSWISMILDRLIQAKLFLRKDGVLFSSIDGIERQSLQHALDYVFGRGNRVEEVIWAQNTTKNTAPAYSTNHEYVEVYARDFQATRSNPMMFRETKPGLKEINEIIDEIGGEYPSPTEIETAIKAIFRDHQSKIKNSNIPDKDDPWKGIYNYWHIEYRDADGGFIESENASNSGAKPWVWREVDVSMPQIKEDSQKKEFRDPASPTYRFYNPIHPLTGKKCPAPKRGWAWPRNPMPGQESSFSALDADNRIAWGPDESKIPQRKSFLNEVETNVAKSVVSDYTDGEKELTNLFGANRTFAGPKPTTLIERFGNQTTDSADTILDFFAGSGTTGHAVINLNREDGGDRKYILIEMGEHFDTVLVPRLKKVIYSKDWKDGKPQSRNTGISHCFKILRLESYEDTLNNLRLHRTREQELALEKFSSEARQDYQLGYMLDLEASGSQSLLNVSAFTDPFDYTLQIATGTAGETKPTQVDLVETFNWLLGLTVLAQGQGGGVTWVEGTNPEGEKVLVLWRNTTVVDAEALNAWCKKQKISVLDGEFTVIYVNGDHHLENLRKDDQTWKVRLTDEEFPKLMWEGCE
jgi:adenine-specific DNA-methyltransferase